jgi:hypothetical protein
MLRNVYIVLVLAALAATSAAASPVVPATAPRFAHHKTLHHAGPAHRPAGHRPAASSAAGHGTGSHRAGRSTSSSPHRPAPRPVSRAAVIRRSPGTGQPTLRRASLVRNGGVHNRGVRARLVHNPVLLPSPLKGSFESLARQNERAEQDGLERILDEDDLASRIDQKLLVPVPESSVLAVNTDLTENHRYCRPWTASFLADLARAHAAQFHKPITVSSAVRTVEYQQHLMHTNGNAAAAEGDIVSPHLTGGTIDIVKQGMSRQELGWMRNHLLSMQLAGTIDVEEEFRQPCFHITVYRNYVAPPPIPGPAPHHTHPGAAAQLASDGK